MQTDLSYIFRYFQPIFNLFSFTLLWWSWNRKKKQVLIPSIPRSVCWELPSQRPASKWQVIGVSAKGVAARLSVNQLGTTTAKRNIVFSGQVVTPICCIPSNKGKILQLQSQKKDPFAQRTLTLCCAQAKPMAQAFSHSTSCWQGQDLENASHTSSPSALINCRRVDGVGSGLLAPQPLPCCHCHCQSPPLPACHSFHPAHSSSGATLAPSWKPPSCDIKTSVFHPCQWHYHF